jgi:hypothetical protein
MQVGSIVECINGTFNQKAIELIARRPKRSKIYTIRGIREYSQSKKTGVLLEELANDPLILPGMKGMFEPTFDIERFRELPEMNINELIENLQLSND